MNVDRATHVPASAFRAAIFAALPKALLPETLPAGLLFQFSSNGCPEDMAGWARLSADRRSGMFGCYRAGLRESWVADDIACMTKARRVARFLEATPELSA